MMVLTVAMVNNPPDVMTVDQVAEYLQIPKQTLYSWNSTGRGPRALKVGRHCRYRRCDVDAWLEAQAATA
jgi:excisionase family DNA binding protein